MSIFAIKAATDAGVYQDEGQYDFDKISEKDEEEEEEENLSSGGPGNDTSAKRPTVKGIKAVPRLKFDFLQPDEPLRVVREETLIESQYNSSLDSVDKLWNQALNMDDDQNMFYDEEEAPRNDEDLQELLEEPEDDLDKNNEE